MDFMKIIESLDEALYTVMCWLIFYPMTLWRAVARPLDMMAYLIERRVIGLKTNTTMQFGRLYFYFSRC